MATNYFGESFYEESLLVRCDCKDHLAEFFMYDSIIQYEYGIEWQSCYNYKKCKGWPTFYFKSFGQFKTFVNYLKEIKSNREFSIESTLRNFENEFSSDGELVVSCQDGYVDFARYMDKKAKKKNKCIWSFYIRESNLPYLIECLEDLVSKAQELENKRMERKSHV